MTTNNKTLLKKTRSNFNKIMRGARLFDFAKQLIQQPRLQDTSTQAMKQRRMHINAEKATSDGVDVELPALKRRQLSPSGSHMMMQDEENPFDEEQALMHEAQVAGNLGEAFKLVTAAKNADKMLEPPPVQGNMYRYWALNDGIFTWDTNMDFCTNGAHMRRALGMLMLFIIQVFAPVAIVASPLHQLDWTQIKWGCDPWYRDWRNGAQYDPEHGVSWFTSRVLGISFIMTYVFWALTKIEDEKKDWLKLNTLLNMFQNEKKTKEHTTKFFLWLGPIVNCFTLVGCGVGMILAMKLSNEPTGTVKDALAFMFLLKLDDLSSDLGFLTPDDWDETQIGCFLSDYQEKHEEEYFTDVQTFPGGDPREPDFNWTDDFDLIDNGATVDHPAYVLTRVLFWALNILALIFWFGVADVKAKDPWAPDLAKLNVTLNAVMIRLAELEYLPGKASEQPVGLRP